MFGNIRNKLTEIKISNAKNIAHNITMKNANNKIAEILAAVHTHTHTRCIVF